MKLTYGLCTWWINLGDIKAEHLKLLMRVLSTTDFKALLVVRGVNFGEDIINFAQEVIQRHKIRLDTPQPSLRLIWGS